MVTDQQNGPAAASSKADTWRYRFGIGGATREANATLEQAQTLPADERIRLARERMRQVVLDRLGGDQALLETVDSIAMSSREAVALLDGDGTTPATEQLNALEAVVAFDGSRPSFLVREDGIDFESSFTTDTWKTVLDPHLADLRGFAACVGRVERGVDPKGTAFLVAPTLALTNRHVAQEIADVASDPPELLGAAFLDFGREHGAGRSSYDRRDIKRVLHVGAQEIRRFGPIDHAKLDVALLELSESKLPAAAMRDRFLPISTRTADVPSEWLVGAVGYPANWRTYVPEELRTRYQEVLTRLLEGDAGTKRFAPGTTTGLVEVGPRWSVMHDATTINGNSGSPMALIRPGQLKVTGVHYGGLWSGERTNWAHVLGRCAEGLCQPGDIAFNAVLARYGING